MVAITSITIGLIGYNFAKNSLEEAGKSALKNNVRMAIEMIDLANEQVENGNLSLEEAQEQVKTHFLGEKNTDGTRPGNKKITVGENDYLLVLNQDGMTLAHPTVEGQNRWMDQSADGLPFTQELIKKAVESDGGFTVYDWTLPSNPDKVAPKISYSELDPNWGWVVVSSSFLQDFNQGTMKLLSALSVCLGISLLIAGILVILFANRVSKPIHMMAQHAKTIAAGDLTVEPLPVSSRDEVGHLVEDFNIMISNLKSLLHEVRHNSQHVHASSNQLMEITDQATKATEQISSAIQEISAGSVDQLQYVKENSQVINEMSAGIEKISSSAQQVSNTARTASENSVEGNQKIQSAVEQMNSINQKVERLSLVVQNLEEHTKEIGQFTGTIGYISEQTNLLALNASIEAARAGEHGRGFAVVAEEIRKLAEQSSLSSKHISSLITTIQNETEKAIESMNEAAKEVVEGIVIVNTAGESFEQIQTSFNGVTNQIHEVSAAAQQISASTVLVVESTNLIANLVEQSTASTQNISAAIEEQLASGEEIAASSIALSEIANESQEFIRKFKL
jgi:methyl-accepting chemotaxis protein